MDSTAVVTSCGEVGHLKDKLVPTTIKEVELQTRQVRYKNAELCKLPHATIVTLTPS